MVMISPLSTFQTSTNVLNSSVVGSKFSSPVAPVMFMPRPAGKFEVVAVVQPNIPSETLVSVGTELP